MNHILREEKKLEGCPGRQLMLATVPGAISPSHYGCGTPGDPFSTDNAILPEQFTEFNPLYRGYFLETIWKTFPFRIGRMSLKCLPPHSCLSVSEHGRDYFVFVIDCEDDVYHLYENHSTWYHIPADEHLYLMSRDRKHTVYNGSNEKAVYLLFELL